MLGAITDSAQTGLYSAAYRLLLLVLAIYYFLMQAVYPRLAAIPEGQQRIQMFRKPLLFAIAAGTGTAMIMAIAKKELISLLFGPAFAASASLSRTAALRDSHGFCHVGPTNGAGGLGSPAASNHCDRNRCRNQSCTEPVSYSAIRGERRGICNATFLPVRFFLSLCARNCSMRREADSRSKPQKPCRLL